MTVYLTPFIRKEDTQIVRQFIEHSSPYFLLNLYSTRGVGRTTFLARIWEKYRQKSPAAFVGVLDFESADKESGYPLDRFLHQILDHLMAYESSSDIVLTSMADEQEQVAELAEKIVELIDDYFQRDLVPLLIIDDYDHLPFGSRSVFEDGVLSKLFEPTRQVAVILSSEQPLYFTNRLDLRVRLRHHELKPLNEKEIARSVPDKYRAIAPDIWKRTAGMPDLIEFIVDKTNRLNIDDAVEYREREGEVLNAEYREQICRVVFPDIHEGCTETLDVLALLRRFDVKVLSHLLPRINAEFATYKQKHYLNLIRELGSRVYWREQGGYALDNILRGMISSYVSVFEPERYKEVNQIIATMYEEWLHEKYRPHYLLEMLYHRLLSSQSEDNDQQVLQRILSELVIDYIQGKRKTQPGEIDELDSLKQLLDQDMDLRPYIGQEVFNTIDNVLMTK